MDLASVNWWTIGIAVAANMLLGYVWFGPLFGKAWRRQLGFVEKVIACLVQGYGHAALEMQRLRHRPSLF